MLRPGEIVVDNFAGGGGASTALERALDRSVDVAINHDAEAIAMHKANHPKTKHYCQNIWQIDPREAAAGRPIGVAWFSPDCKHFSKAKGGKPVEKRIRDLAWVVVHWAKLVKPRIIFLENVEEFKDWGPLAANGRPCPLQKGLEFRRWCRELKKLGYRLKWGELRAHDFGAPTIRKRLFMVARCDGGPLPWPEPTHGPGRLPYRTAAECIDWSIPCHSIFLTKEEGRAVGVKRPLAPATMARIARGVKRFVLDAAEPFIVTCNHGGDWFRGQGLEQPFNTVTAARDAHGLVQPFVARIDHQSSPSGADDIGDPLTTVTGKNRHALVAPFVAGVGGRAGQSPERCLFDTFGTVTAKNDRALVAPFLVPRYGEREGQAPRCLAPAEPMPTIVPTGNGAGLVAAHLSRQFGNSVGSDLSEPAGTVTAGGGGKSALIAAFMAQHNTGVVGHAMGEPVSTIVQKGCTQGLVAAHLSHLRPSNTNGGQGDPRQPIRALTAGGQHQALVAAFLAKYYGTGGQWQDPAKPLHTIPSLARFAAVTVAIDGETFVLVDIAMRMLEPRELFRAQGFPPGYIIDPLAPDKRGRLRPLPKSGQVRGCGNSVSPPPAEALIRCVMEAGQSVRAAV